MIDFKRMRWLINKLRHIQWEVEQKESNAMRVTSHITGMPRGGGTNKQEEAYIILADVLDAYHESLAELDNMRTELKPLIDILDDPDERAVMRMRYMNGYRPETIAIGIHVEERTVYRYLKLAEKKITECFKPVNGCQ